MNRKRSSRLVKILILLFLINSLSLLIYFLSPSSPKPQQEQKQHQQLQQKPSNQPSRSKPWPILPSFLPWWAPPLPRVRSCEAFFGNGFTRRFHLANSSSGSGGWFECRFSETLESSVCEGGSVRMSPERIKMARGGERLDDVIGREEVEELPEFEDGAFVVDGGDGVKVKRRLAVLGGRDGLGLDEFLPAGEVLRHTMRGLVGSSFVVPSKDFLCDEWIEEPTILVTRFEYANLFHTVTDWYSAYVASRVTGLPNRPHLIFVDGHCMSPLEDTWRALFSSLRYAKNFTGSVCFRHLILAPLGYETPLFKGLTDEIDCDSSSAQELRRNPDGQKTARVSEFGEMIRAAFGFPVNNRPQAETGPINVLFVRREDYLAHPRHKGKVESRLTNEEEVFNAVKAWASSSAGQNGCWINVVNGLFAHMSMREQVRAIQDARVIVGAHGAGMTHIVSALPGTVVLEIISSFFRRPHFRLISRWRGLKYRAINLLGSTADPRVVVESLSDIEKEEGKKVRFRLNRIMRINSRQRTELLLQLRHRLV